MFLSTKIIFFGNNLYSFLPKLRLFLTFLPKSKSASFSALFLIRLLLRISSISVSLGLATVGVVVDSSTLSSTGEVVSLLILT